MKKWLVVGNELRANDARDKIYVVLGMRTGQDRLCFRAHSSLRRRDLLYSYFVANNLPPVLHLPIYCPGCSCQPDNVDKAERHSDCECGGFQHTLHNRRLRRRWRAGGQRRPTKRSASSRAPLTGKPCHADAGEGRAMGELTSWLLQAIRAFSRIY